jgi:hypothetical protein
MVCGYATICFGGDDVTHYFKEVTKTMTYDCKAKCQGTLFFSCCDECRRNEKAAQQGTFAPADVVRCPDCGADQQQAIADRLRCSLQQGRFVCEGQGNCSIGDPDIKVETEAYTCNVIPCDDCLANQKGRQLQAACCSACLEEKCNGPQNRTVCQGCDVPPPPPPAEPEPLKWWEWAVFILLILLIFFAGGCLCCFPCWVQGGDDPAWCCLPVFFLLGGMAGLVLWWVFVMEDRL